MDVTSSLYSHKTTFVGSRSMEHPHCILSCLQSFHGFPQHPKQKRRVMGKGGVGGKDRRGEEKKEGVEEGKEERKSFP